MEVKIAKFSLYPQGEPTGYAVGFSVELDNGRSFYRDTTVPLEDATDKTDNEIAQLAYTELREGILATAEVEGAKSPIIGEIIIDES